MLRLNANYIIHSISILKKVFKFLIFNFLNLWWHRFREVYREKNNWRLPQFY